MYKGGTIPRRVKLIFFAACIALLLGVPGCGEATAEEHMQQADAYFQDGQWDGAIA